MGKPPGGWTSPDPLHPPGLPAAPGSKTAGTGASPAATVAGVAAPAAVAPASPASPDVLQAQRDVRRQALKKKGFSKTVFAGDTAGWNPSNTSPTPVGTGGGYPGNKTLGGG